MGLSPVRLGFMYISSCIMDGLKMGQSFSLENLFNFGVIKYIFWMGPF